MTYYTNQNDLFMIPSAEVRCFSEVKRYATKELKSIDIDNDKGFESQLSNFLQSYELGLKQLNKVLDEKLLKLSV